MENRALDKWIAKNIMGLTPEVIEEKCRKRYAKNARQQQGAGMLGTETWDKDCEEWRKGYYRDSEIPYYTKPDSNIFQVVEKFKKKNFAFHLHWRPELKDWWANFVDVNGESYFAVDEFKELAVCLSAKKVIEETII